MFILIQATDEEINASYRRLSKIFHPDKHVVDPSKQKEAMEFFTKIKKAHEGEFQLFLW